MRSEREIGRAIERHADMMRRICMVHLKNRHDTEDIFQNVFLKYAMNDAAFESEEHEKAWLIRVTINECKDLLKSIFRKCTVSLEEATELPAAAAQTHSVVLEAVCSLPQKYRDVVYLHYYEGYSAVEIAGMLSQNVNSIYTRLARARKALQEQLGGETDET